MCLIRLEAETTWEHEPEAAVPAVLSTPLYIKAIYIQEGSKLQSSTLGHLFPPLQHHPENYSHQHPEFIIPPASHTKKCNFTDYHHKSVQKIKHMRVAFIFPKKLCCSSRHSKKTLECTLEGSAWNREEAQPYDLWLEQKRTV